MEKNKILTAEEFLKDLQTEFSDTQEYRMYFTIDIPSKMIEFAKLHVKAALEAAAENAETKMPKWDILDVWTVDKDSIINAYPLTNIV